MFYNFTLNYLIIGHHKAGSTAAQHMMKNLVSYCHKIDAIKSRIVSFGDKKSIALKDQKRQNMFWHWISSINLINTNINVIADYNKENKISYTNNITHFINDTIIENTFDVNKNKHFIHLFNFIREPVSTIVSGFKYHSKFVNGDPWLREPISEAEKISCIYSNSTILDEIRQYGIDLGINNNTFDIMEYYKHLNVNLFYQKMINISIPFAIYIEFQRYQCFEWPNMIGIFNFVNDIKYYLNSKFQYTDFKMKVSKFSKNDVVFDVSSQFERFGNAMNIKFEYFFQFSKNSIDFEQNDNKNVYKNLENLSNFDESSLKLLHLIPSIDSSHYRALLNDFQIINYRTWNDSEIKQNSHITSDSDKDPLYIDALLSNVDTCHLIKKQTKMLDYHWFYQKYC